MNYTKLAKEARKLYHALRDENFNDGEAYDITKVCVRDYPIFQEMIEKEEDEKIIGYLYFVDGHKEPIYKYVSITYWTDEVHMNILNCFKGESYVILDYFIHRDCKYYLD